MTYHLHQLDAISYLLLELLKLISQVSTKSYFPTIPVLIYAHPQGQEFVDLHYRVLKFTIIMLWLLHIIEAVYMYIVPVNVVRVYFLMLF